VVTLSHRGYAKAQPLDVYQAQRRGGKGKTATATKDEDFVDKLFVASTHDTILCFSSAGKVYWLKVYQLPQAGRNARGKPMVNLLPLEEGERISAVLPIREYEEGKFVFMATEQEGDQLIGVDLTDGDQDIMLFSSAGKAVRFNESAVRPMGRTAAGVRGIRLDPGQRKGRGGKGLISIRTSERNGDQIGATLVEEEDEIMLISDGGTLVRTRVSDVPRMGRDTQGVKMISLTRGEKLIGIARIEVLDE